MFDNEVLVNSLSHQKITVQHLEAQAPSDGLLIHHQSYSIQDLQDTHITKCDSPLFGVTS